MTYNPPRKNAVKNMTIAAKDPQGRAWSNAAALKQMLQ
jgi:hypothetical protein